MRVGAQVQLLTGGSIMTVEEMLSSGQIKCSWEDENGTLQEGVFEPGALVPVNPDGFLRKSLPGESSLS
jgi:uncharacterized protein YodC (DUF2158 family)